MYKRCKKCDEIKFFGDFYTKVSKTGKTYIRGSCKTCHIKQSNIGSKKRRKKDGGSSRHLYDIKRKYGISKKEYLALLKKQNNKCAICYLIPKNRLCVDHNHQTNKIRGLLCHRCNRVLGIVNDNPKIIKKILKYLYINNNPE